MSTFKKVFWAIALVASYAGCLWGILKGLKLSSLLTLGSVVLFLLCPFFWVKDIAPRVARSVLSVWIVLAFSLVVLAKIS
jgi:hypothetical protein